MGHRQRPVLLGRGQAAHGDLGVRRRTAARRCATRRRVAGEAAAGARRAARRRRDRRRSSAGRAGSPARASSPPSAQPRLSVAARVSGASSDDDSTRLDPPRRPRRPRPPRRRPHRGARLGRAAAARDRCRAAVATGRQLWPVATLAEYRLALVAPPEWAAPMIAEDAGLFTIGPLTEVIAQHHTWAELRRCCRRRRRRRRRPRAGAARRTASSTRSVAQLPDVLDLPYELAAWEPAYPLATYSDDGVDAPAPPAADRTGRATRRLAPRSSSSTTTPSSSPSASSSRRGRPRSNGRAEVACVEGTADDAVARARPSTLDGRPLTLADALAWLAWAGASGGAHGRRRGAALGRFGALWVLAALLDLTDDWPVPLDQLGDRAESLRWSWWEPASPTDRLAAAARRRGRRRRPRPGRSTPPTPCDPAGRPAHDEFGRQADLAWPPAVEQLDDQLTSEPTALRATAAGPWSAVVWCRLPRRCRRTRRRTRRRARPDRPADCGEGADRQLIALAHQGGRPRRPAEQPGGGSIALGRDVVIGPYTARSSPSPAAVIAPIAASRRRRTTGNVIAPLCSLGRPHRRDDRVPQLSVTIPKRRCPSSRRCSTTATVPPSSSRSTAAIDRAGRSSTNTVGSRRRAAPRARVIATQAVGDEPVDGCGRHPGRGGATSGTVAGEEQQVDAGGGDRFGDAIEDLQGGGVAEGVVQPIGEDDPDRPNPAAAEAGGGGSGPP